MRKSKARKKKKRGGGGGGGGGGYTKLTRKQERMLAGLSDGDTNPDLLQLVYDSWHSEQQQQQQQLGSVHSVDTFADSASFSSSTSSSPFSSEVAKMEMLYRLRSKICGYYASEVRAYRNDGQTSYCSSECVVRERK